MAEIEKTLGKVIRRLREKKHYTQDGFAHYAGINRGYYGEIERGESEVSVGMIQAIAKALGLEMSELFALVEQEERNEKA